LNAFKKEIKELKPVGSSTTTIITATDICHLTASFIDKTLLESVKKISQFSASCVEQLLRIAESYLIEIDTTKLSQEELLKRAAFSFSVSLMLVEELSNISVAFIDCIRTLCEEGKLHFSEFGTRGEKEMEESVRCSEDIETKMNLHINHIYLDTSNGISNVEECRKHLLSICKYVVTNAVQANTP